MTQLVVDASAVVDALTLVPAPEPLIRAVSTASALHVPEHFHIEVVAALRNMRIRGDLEEHAARIGLRRVHRLRVERYPVLELQPEIWALRHSLTAYDAAYLALARRLETQLLTTDRGLAAAAAADGRLLIPD